MSNFRIIPIKNCKTCTSLLVAKQRDTESGNDFIELTAWHTNKDNETYIQSDSILENQPDSMLESMIANFPEKTAQDFVDSFTF